METRRRGAGSRRRVVRIGMVLTGLALLAVLTPPTRSAGGANSYQESDSRSEPSDPWGALRLLEGWWEGRVEGRLGTGTAVRRYEFVIGGNYLLGRHASVRLPQDRSPDGDHHEEMGVFSFDRDRQKIIYREFMVEGVVPRSVCETEGTRIICTSEAVESGPGMRARLTLEIIDRFRFVEQYELAFPGEDLEPYIAIEWTRKPVPDVWN